MFLSTATHLLGLFFPLLLSFLPNAVESRSDFMPALAFSANRLRRREVRYFTATDILHPLNKIPFTKGSAGFTANSTLILPYSSPTGAPLPMLYTNDPKMVNRWLVDHVPMEGCVIGFDTESVPDAPWVTSKFKGRPATVQLATSDASIVIPLIWNNRYSKACLPLIEAVLSDPNIIKCGCSIEDDMLDLKRLVPGLGALEARSRFDVGLLGASKNRLGLKALARILLNLDLEKPKRIAISNWSHFPLSGEQLNYAARDAWAGVAVLEELQQQYPATFGTEALVERLKPQPTLKDLNTSQTRRQKAKMLLSRFQTPYHKRNVIMPPNVAEKVSHLKGVLKETQLDLSLVESLGFIPDEAR